MIRFSIITVTFNSARFLRQTIESVLRQDYPHVEYIIVDGMSTDGTQAIIEEYRARMGHYCAEPDRNMYDALNKGMRLATGDYIGVLNSDDFFASETVLSQVAENIRFDEAQHHLGYYGDLVKVDKDGNSRGRRYGFNIDFTGLLASEQLTFVGHGTVFLHRSCLDRVGFYDDMHFKYAGDYDYILRCLKAGALKHISVPVFCFRTHDESITSSGKIRPEVVAILKKHNATKRTVLKRILWTKWLCLNWKSMCYRLYERVKGKYRK